ncbi:unnamed protein product [Blepharisma stoltei]|uniref:Sphingomyelin synthase-like domain-containing protein n=1 Tax=Blepharisma stoltei TaxID=1481888 RepID=A0AAU9IMG8_9CILI|nr:unnamed protein product [Blepharisma stoltei]
MYQQILRYISNLYSNLKQKINQENLSTPTRKRLFYSRIIIMFVLMIIVITNTFTATAVQTRRISCLWDFLLEATSLINQYFFKHEIARNILLIITSAAMDILVLYHAISFMLWGNSLKPVIWLILYIGLWFLFQWIFLMRFPSGFTWGYPGFPSLTISYIKSADFYFSARMGALVYFGILSHEKKNKYLTWAAIINIILSFWMMIFFRAHYSIDLIFGGIFGHYCIIISEKISPWIDKKTKLQ